METGEDAEGMELVDDDVIGGTAQHDDQAHQHENGALAVRAEGPNQPHNEQSSLSEKKNLIVEVHRDDGADGAGFRHG